MLKAVALIGTGIAIGRCYQFYQKDPQKSKEKNLDKNGKSSKGNDDSVKE
ncbi:hypothetical protein [Acinetobacter sp. ANC 4648]|nr:hypothetical protein [Acinetobacter sp. ANC 4648]